MRKYVVTDKVCDGAALYEGFLAQDESARVSSCDDGNGNRSVICQRSDGPLVLKEVSEGVTIDLD